jgi:hypothetical protein
MSTQALRRLLELCPPPSRPAGATGERAEARAALGWPVPDHVFDVVEAYGEVSWCDWLLMPSPFTDDGRASLANSAPLLDGIAADAGLVAFSDPEEALVFCGADGAIAVSSPAGVETGGSLAETLLGWLDGSARRGLPAIDALAGAPDIGPCALPLWSDTRRSRVTWMFVRGGAPSRAARWAALAAALGPHRRISVNGDGEARQDKVHVDELELDLTYDTINVRDGVEQLHLRHYLDRQPDVKAALAGALAAAGLELVRVEGPRGRVDW